MRLPPVIEITSSSDDDDERIPWPSLAEVVWARETANATSQQAARVEDAAGAARHYRKKKEGEIVPDYDDKKEKKKKKKKKKKRMTKRRRIRRTVRARCSSRHPRRGESHLIHDVVLHLSPNANAFDILCVGSLTELPPSSPRSFYQHHYHSVAKLA